MSDSLDLPMGHQAWDCGCPRPLSAASEQRQSGRGLPHARTLTRKRSRGVLACALAVGLFAFSLPAADPALNRPRILIANDTCPDVTWGFTEAQVRQSFADLIAAHLDEMSRTDADLPESRDHYNVMAFLEV